MADKIDAFLERIAQLESTSGQNVDHKLVEQGSNKGERAIGRFGIMPNTAIDILTRAKLPEAKLSKEALQAKLATDPAFERKVARVLASYVLEKHGNDPEKAAFSWRMGHNIDTQVLTPEKLESSGYVREFKKLPDPRAVDYRDNPQVNPMPKQKSLIERAKESASGFLDRISAAPEEARREHVARVAAIFAKTDPSLSQADAMRQAERSLELSEQAGSMAGSLKDAGRIMRENARIIGRDLIKRASRGMDYELPAKAAIEEADEVISKIKDMREPLQPKKMQFENPIDPDWTPKVSERGDKSYQRMMQRAPEIEVDQYENLPAVADVEAQIAALKRIREGR